MQSTVTDLTQDLNFRLRAAGMNPGTAQAVTNLLPPAGQARLANELRDNENAAQELGHTYLANLQDLLGVDYITTDEVRAQLLAVTR